jgi:hypothetical protein
LETLDLLYDFLSFLINGSIPLELPSSIESKDGEEKLNIEMHQDTLEVRIEMGIKML